MKKFLLATAAVLAMAGGVFAKDIQGCEVVDMGGYFNKADPTCNFNGSYVGSRVIVEGQENTVVGVIINDPADPTDDVPVYGQPGDRSDGGLVFADNGNGVQETRTYSDN